MIDNVVNDLLTYNIFVLMFQIYLSFKQKNFDAKPV